MAATRVVDKDSSSGRGKWLLQKYGDIPVGPNVYSTILSRIIWVDATSSGAACFGSVEVGKRIVSVQLLAVILLTTIATATAEMSPLGGKRSQSRDVGLDIRYSILYEKSCKFFFTLFVVANMAAGPDAAAILQWINLIVAIPLAILTPLYQLTYGADSACSVRQLPRARSAGFTVVLLVATLSILQRRCVRSAFMVCRRRRNSLHHYHRRLLVLLGVESCGRG